MTAWLRAVGLVLGLSNLSIAQAATFLDLDWDYLSLIHI